MPRLAAGNTLVVHTRCVIYPLVCVLCPVRHRTNLYMNIWVRFVSLVGILFAVDKPQEASQETKLQELRRG